MKRVYYYEEFLKRYAAGLAAVMMASSFAACGSSSGTAEDTTTSATTTTGVTVEINTETLASEEQVTMDDVSKLLPDVELENKNIKWFSFYDPFHATTSGNTKALSLELFEKKYGGTIEYIPTHGASALPTFPQTFWAVQASTSSQAATLTLSPKGIPQRSV